MKMPPLETELLALILLQLEVQDLLRCKQVCKKFRSVIEEIISLQYKIECELYGVVDYDANHFSHLERLSRLRESQKAWMAGVPSERFSISVDNSSPISVSGNIFAYLDNTRCIRMIQIPSRYRNVNKREWAVGDLPFQIRGFAVDHNQHLLIVVEDAVEAEELRIHILDSENGHPHPLSKSPSISVPLKPVTPNTHKPYPLYISNDLFGVAAWGEDTLELRVWNWKTSELKLSLFGLDGRSFAFINQTHVLLPMLPAASPGDIEETDAKLLLVTCNNNERMSLKAASSTAAVATFLLPSPLGCAYTTINVSLDATALPPHDAKVPFGSNPQLRLVRIELCATGMSNTFLTLADPSAWMHVNRTLLVPLRSMTSLAPQVDVDGSALRLQQCTCTPVEPRRCVNIAWTDWSRSMLAVTGFGRVEDSSGTRALVMQGYSFGTTADGGVDVNPEVPALFDFNSRPPRRDPALRRTGRGPPPLAGGGAEGHLNLKAVDKALWARPCYDTACIRKYDWVSRWAKPRDGTMLMEDAFVRRDDGTPMPDSTATDYYFYAF